MSLFDRRTIWLLLVAATIAPGTLRAQTDIPDDQSSSSNISEDQSKELERRKAIIASGDANSRRLMADSLLDLEYDAAIELTIGFLRLSDGPEAAVAVCNAIAVRGSAGGRRLSERLVDPLLELLANDDPVLVTSATEAVGAFPGETLAKRLGDIAADTSKPMSQRVAAVEVMAAEKTSFENVSQLIRLTEASDAEIRKRAIAAVKSASSRDFGDDGQQWRAWWESLDKVKWLQDRLNDATQVNASLQESLDASLRDDVERDRLILERFSESLRELYTLKNQQSQRDGLIIDWLSDRLSSPRRAALALIRERIGEGDLPSEQVQTAVKACLSHRAAAVRTAALEVIGNVKSTGDAVRIITLLETEDDNSVRETALRALGRLENPEAIPVLVAELETAGNTTGRLREAARAIGQIGLNGDNDLGEAIQSAIDPLKSRLAEAPEDAIRLREAILNAMASIGNDAFVEVFAMNLASKHPELVLPAIRGVERTKATEHLSQLVGHLEHADPRVRLLSVEALGTLGTDSTHLEALFRRFSPDTESNRGVREAAWNGFRRVLMRLPKGRESWVARLDDLAKLETLVGDWSDQNGVTPELLAARRKSVDILVREGRFDDALNQMRQLRNDYLAVGDERVHAAGVELLTTELRNGNHERFAELVVDIASSAASNGLKTDIEDAIIGELSGNSGLDETTRHALISQLQTIPDGTLTSEWPAKLQTVSVKPPNADEPTDSPTP